MKIMLAFWIGRGRLGETKVTKVIPITTHQGIILSDEQGYPQTLNKSENRAPIS